MLVSYPLKLMKDKYSIVSRRHLYKSVIANLDKFTEEYNGEEEYYPRVLRARSSSSSYSGYSGSSSYSGSPSSYYKSYSNSYSSSSKYYANTYYSATYGQRYSTYANSPTYYNVYFSNGKTYQPLYVYYKPSDYYNPAGYYSTTFLMIYYDGYGYNFYYHLYGYYEYSVNDVAGVETLVLVLVGIFAAGVICFLSFFFYVMFTAKKDAEDEEGDRSKEDFDQIEENEEHVVQEEEFVEGEQQQEVAYPYGVQPGELPPAYPPPQYPPTF